MTDTCPGNRHSFSSSYRDGEYCVRCDKRLCMWCAMVGGHREGCDRATASTDPADPQLMVEIGGVRMTQDQFDAARYPLLHPDATLASAEPGADRTEPHPVTGVSIPITGDGSTDWPRFAAELRGASDSVTPENGTAKPSGDAALDALCQLSHEAYERGAAAAEWFTNPASRVAWADVPESNKVAMRAAVAAVAVRVRSQARAEAAAEKAQLIGVNQSLHADLLRAEHRLAVAEEQQRVAAGSIDSEIDSEQPDSATDQPGSVAEYDRAAGGDAALAALVEVRMARYYPHTDWTDCSPEFQASFLDDVRADLAAVEPHIAARLRVEAVAVERQRIGSFLIELMTGKLPTEPDYDTAVRMLRERLTASPVPVATPAELVDLLDVLDEGNCEHGSDPAVCGKCDGPESATGPTAKPTVHDAECENNPPRRGASHCGCRRRAVLRSGSEITDDRPEPARWRPGDLVELDNESIWLLQHDLSGILIRGAWVPGDMGAVLDRARLLHRNNVWAHRDELLARNRELTTSIEKAQQLITEQADALTRHRTASEGGRSIIRLLETHGITDGDVVGNLKAALAALGDGG